MVDIKKITLADIQNQITQGNHAANLINNIKKTVNELVDYNDTIGSITGYEVGTEPNQIPTNAMIPLVTTLGHGFMRREDKAKINGIQEGATKNQTDGFLLNRPNHTGEQPMSTVTGLEDELSQKALKSIQITTGNNSGLTGGGDLTTNRDLKVKFGTTEYTVLEGKLKGAADGLAELDAQGKLKTTQIPDSLLGSIRYQGTWNASTNTPTLPTPSIDNKGYYYVANTEGTQFGIHFAIGDWVISNGTEWQEVDNTRDVISVAGKQGVVTLNKNDVGLNNVDNTTDSAKNVLSASKLTTSRTINGVGFDGTTNITLPTVNTTGQQTINGSKKFNDGIEVPLAPTLPSSAASKKYVDDVSATRLADAPMDDTFYGRYNGEWEGLDVLSPYEIDGGDAFTTPRITFDGGGA